MTIAWRLVVALGLMLVLEAPLGAHMEVTRATPVPDSTVTTPPAAVQIWFTEPPDVAVSKLELSGPDGKAVELATPHAMPDKSLMATASEQLVDGLYTIRWQSAGNDGHVLKGEYTFTLRRGR